MDILDRINARKREEVAEAVQRMPVAALERSPFFSRPVRSISRAVRESVKHGIIAASLAPQAIVQLTRLAHELGLEVLLEVHDAEELERTLHAGADLIGVNNRNLRTFRTDLDTSRKLISLIPAGVTAISESGISSPAIVAELESAGYRGFLIGNHFMSMPDPGEACRQFTETVMQQS